MTMVKKTWQPLIPFIYRLKVTTGDLFQGVYVIRAYPAIKTGVNLK